MRSRPCAGTTSTVTSARGGSAASGWQGTTSRTSRSGTSVTSGTCFRSARTRRRSCTCLRAAVQAGGSSGSSPQTRAERRSEASAAGTAARCAVLPAPALADQRLRLRGKERGSEEVALYVPRPERLQRLQLLGALHPFRDRVHPQRPAELEDRLQQLRRRRIVAERCHERPVDLDRVERERVQVPE